MADDLTQISNRDILLEMRADIKSVMLGHAVLGERVDNGLKKLDDVKTALDNHIDDDDKKHAAIDKDVSSLNDWRNKIMGIIIVLGVAASFIGGIARDAIASAFHWR